MLASPPTLTAAKLGGLQASMQGVGMASMQAMSLRAARLPGLVPQRQHKEGASLALHAQAPTAASTTEMEPVHTEPVIVRAAKVSADALCGGSALA